MAASLDSNVVIYLTDRDPEKAARSKALIAEGGWISAQVMNEVAAVARRKVRLAWPAVHELLALVRSFFIVEPLTLATHDQTLFVAERYKLDVYDSAVVASALLAGCDTLWSEDMHDGLVVQGALTIRNPYRSS
ncbi:MAG TPA: PIN domain-containing protein [Allosphingosinicella sp.]|jgi:predicted nucleic acid-binding protein